MKTLQKDLTTGNPGKIIFNFTLPIFIGNVFQQFYSMADTIIVGKFVGTKALAAVEISTKQRHSLPFSQNAPTI